MVLGAPLELKAFRHTAVRVGAAGASRPEESSAGSRRFPCPQGLLMAGPGSPGWAEAPQGRPSRTGCQARARGPACVRQLGLVFSLYVQVAFLVLMRH